MNNKVIYTCLVGDYDELLQPKFTDKNFDYICFCDEIQKSQIGVWKIRKIPFFHKDKTRKSRYVKLNPHQVLPEYEYSIWIDANIEILDNTLYENAMILINKGVVIAQVKHFASDCIYEDLYKCMRFSRDRIRILLKQYKFLKSQTYPKNNGLYENNLILRQHNNSKVINISEKWWSIFMKFSRRDQLSLVYIYWKENFNPDILLPMNSNTRNNSGFKYHLHKSNIIKKSIFKLKIIRNSIILYFIKFPN